MPRRTRQRQAVIALLVIAAVGSLVAFLGGVSFELGRWLARSDTDHSFAPVEDWLGL